MEFCICSVYAEIYSFISIQGGGGTAVCDPAECGRIRPLGDGRWSRGMDSGDSMNRAGSDFLAWWCKVCLLL